LSRVPFSFDLPDFLGASNPRRDAVAHVRGEERLACGESTDSLRFEIGFVHTDDGMGFGPAFFIFHTVTVAPKATLFDAGSGGSTTWTVW
jgi:hypothetical protein